MEGLSCEGPVLEAGGKGVSTGNMRSMHTVGDQNMPPQTMPLWHKDHFELEANENQQMCKDTFPELPQLCKSQNFWKMGTDINPLSPGS